jgi:hypothetical protein
MKQVVAVAFPISRSGIPERGSTSRGARLNVKSVIVKDLFQHPAVMPYLLRVFARRLDGDCP